MKPWVLGRSDFHAARKFNADVFLWILRNFEEQLFLRTPLVAASYGRLTLPLIDTVENFYGLAIRTNKGDCKKMAKATRAIRKHYSSTADKPKDEECTVGSNSWSSKIALLAQIHDVVFRETAKQTNEHVPDVPIRNTLPPAFVTEIQPIFDRFGSETFLAACEHCKTYKHKHKRIIS